MGVYKAGPSRYYGFMSKNFRERRAEAAAKMPRVQKLAAMVRQAQDNKETR